MAVFDAPVIVKLLTEPDELPGAVMAELAGGSAPHLLDAEVGHVLRRRVRLGLLAAPGVRCAVRVL